MTSWLASIIVPIVAAAIGAIPAWRAARYAKEARHEVKTNSYTSDPPTLRDQVGLGRKETAQLRRYIIGLDAKLTDHIKESEEYRTDMDNTVSTIKERMDDVEILTVQTRGEAHAGL